MHMVSNILDIKTLVKFVANRLDPFIVIKKQKLYPFFRTYWHQGLRGTLQDLAKKIGGEARRASPLNGETEIQHSQLKQY